LTLSLRRWATFAWLIVGALSLAMLAMSIVRLPSDEVGLLRRFPSPEIAPDIRISQTFEMTTDGLRDVEFSAVAIGQVSGDIRMELHDITGHDDRLMRSADVGAADVVGVESYRFEFSPVLDSRNRIYQLDLTASGTNPADGVAVWATKGERYTGGTMLVNGVPRWADMAFKAHAPAPSGLQLLTAGAVDSSVSRGHVVLAAFAAVWIAFGLFLRAFSRIPDDKMLETS
jgi:hypothetical protein